MSLYLDSSLTCKYEVKSKQMSVAEICFLQKIEIVFGSFFQILSKMPYSQRNYFMKHFSSFSSFKTLPTILNVWFIRHLT